MARKKNSESNSILTLGTTEDTQVINSSDIEAKEAELLTAKEDEEEEKTAEEPKAEVKAEEAPKTESVKEEEPKPKRQRRSRKTVSAQDIVTTEAQNSNLDLSKEVVLAKESVESIMNAMVAQFTAIKELTTGVNSQLEKMNSLIKEMSPTQNPSLEELVKPQGNPQFITKFATAASLVAMLLSILSMSMSQSARQATLSASLSNKENTSVQSTQPSNELAMSLKDFQSKKKQKK